MRLIPMACALALIGHAPGCGPAGNNEDVFAGGGGHADPNVPQSTADYDLKYQDTPPPTAKSKAR